MEINKKLDSALEALRGDMTDTLSRWVRTPSVRAEKSAENAPFGADIRHMLDVALADLDRLGFNPRDIDGYCADGEMGEGDESIAVLAHLDVVPEGEGWGDIQPYGAQIINGHMYGRGTADDKGPAIAALFAMKAIQNAGIPLRKKIRVILGCDEECGMEDLAHYESKYALPERGFSPDANFPVINTEKGILQMTLHAPVCDERILSLQSGIRCNVVPNIATAVLAGDVREEAAEAFCVEDEDCQIETELENGNTRVTVTGVPAHGSMPEKGKNAAKMLLAVLQTLGMGGNAVSALVKDTGTDTDGTGLGIAGCDAVSGPLTINLGILSIKDGMLQVTFDCRYPIFFYSQTIVNTVKAVLAEGGYEMVSFHDSIPHHVPAESKLVTSLVDVYNSITGENLKAFAIGGGTYARHLKEGVAFGMTFPGEPETEHQAGENICLESFYKAARIYAYAIVALCA